MVGCCPLSIREIAEWLVAHALGELCLAEVELAAAADHDPRQRLIGRQAFELGPVSGVACAAAHRLGVGVPAGEMF